MMPDIDGWGIYHEIKAQPATAHIPVIIVSARAQAADRAIALRVNQVDDYITKPFTPAQLIESIERVLDKRSDS
jgi:CheY-like chemotaxis protein